VNPFGILDPTAMVLRVEGPDDRPVLVRLSDHPDLKLENSSLASQAVGPPNNEFEMSFAGRTFPVVGKKMVHRRALALQEVASDDSVLGGIRSSRFPTGLKKKYASMIRAAFRPEWWRSNKVIQINPDNTITTLGPMGSLDPVDDDEELPSRDDDEGLPSTQFTMMELNFSLFFGLAIQMYESILIANDSRVDQFLEGRKDALTQQEQLRMTVFTGKGKCFNCHGGAELTNASVSNLLAEILERMVMGDREIAVYDDGFYNIGVRPTTDDIGVGGTAPSGLPLSNTRFFQLPQNIAQAPPIAIRPNESPLLANPTPLSATERVTVDGAFKVPGLRNVELTAPYFHNGGMLTLEQVVDFYNRGGDFVRENRENLDPDIEQLMLTAEEKAALVAFLKALTDERVRFHRAPFDHPQLIVPDGAFGNRIEVSHLEVSIDDSGNALEIKRTIPAVGKDGLANPPKNFLQ
jgi:cytochrome c peroxidase